MHEEKIPKEAWYVGVVLVVCAAVAILRRVFGERGSTTRKKKIKNEKPVASDGSKLVDVNINRQFWLKDEQTAYVAAEGLRIKFSGVLEDKNGVGGALGRWTENNYVTIQLEVAQDVGGVTESGIFQLTTFENSELSDVITTGEDLLDDYNIRLLGVLRPNTGLKKNDYYEVNLVVTKNS